MAKAPVVVPQNFEDAFAEAAIDTSTSTAAMDAALKQPPRLADPEAHAQAAQAENSLPLAAPAAGLSPEAVQGELELRTAEEIAEAEAAQAAQQHPPEPKASDEDMLKRFAALMAQAQPAPVQQQQPQLPQVGQQPAPVYDQNELAQLNQFYTDWPDVAPAVATLAKGMVANAMRSIYQDIAREMAPFVQTVNALADRTQLQDLETQVPDYAQIADQLTSWVDKQPTWLRPAYQRVIDSGTSAEVIDLINLYKGTVGSATTQQQPQGGTGVQAQTQARSATELSPAARQAAARLAPISSKRANATTAAPQDFDGAFAEAARTA